MNMNEKDIDHLTRKLMRGTAEQPSASLNSRIMALIIQEKKRVYKYYIKKRFTPVGIFSIFVAYMLVLVGILYLVKLSPGGAETVLGSLRAYFPIVLTIASGISCFFLFTQLDNWLKREEIRRQNTSKYKYPVVETGPAPALQPINWACLLDFHIDFLRSESSVAFHH